LENVTTKGAKAKIRKVLNIMFMDKTISVCENIRRGQGKPEARKKRAGRKEGE